MASIGSLGFAYKHRGDREAQEDHDYESHCRILTNRSPGLVRNVSNRCAFLVRVAIAKKEFPEWREASGKLQKDPDAATNERRPGLKPE
jgi:hypothetical protein